MVTGNCDRCRDDQLSRNARAHLPAGVVKGGLFDLDQPLTLC